VKEAFVPPPQFDTFLEEAQKLGPQIGHAVLDEIVKVYDGAAQFVTDLKNVTEQVVRHSRKTGIELQEIIEKNNITMTELTRRLEKRISEIELGLKDKVDKVDRRRSEDSADARAQVVVQVLDEVQVAYVVVVTEAGVPQGQAEDQYDELAGHVKAIFLIIGEFINKYPILLDVVIFVVSMLLIPEIPIFRSVFLLLGFGLKGPVKGSVAAWLQSRLWGRAVARGSWFAILQKAGMKLTGGWLEKLAASAGLAAILGHAT